MVKGVTSDRQEIQKNETPGGLDFTLASLVLGAAMDSLVVTEAQDGHLELRE